MKIAAALWLAFAAGAHAGTGTWLCDITTPNGDSVVEPGETATLRFSIDFTPRSREIDADTGLEVYGFSHSVADFLGAENWATGNVTWQMNTRLIFAYGDLTTKDHTTQDLTDVTAWQIGRSLGGPDGLRDDPIWIIDVYWDPRGDYTPRSVAVETRTRGGILGGADQQVGVWEMDGGIDKRFFYAAIEEMARFNVVPAPGSLVAAVVGTPIVFRRRRD